MLDFKYYRSDAEAVLTIIVLEILSVLANLESFIALFESRIRVARLYHMLEDLVSTFKFTKSVAFCDTLANTTGMILDLMIAVSLEPVPESWIDMVENLEQSNLSDYSDSLFENFTQTKKAYHDMQHRRINETTEHLDSPVNSELEKSAGSSEDIMVAERLFLKDMNDLADELRESDTLFRQGLRSDTRSSSVASFSIHKTAAFDDCLGLENNGLWNKSPLIDIRETAPPFGTLETTDLDLTTETEKIDNLVNGSSLINNISNRKDSPNFELEGVDQQSLANVVS